MAITFRPRLEGLEARETPTSFASSFLSHVPNPAQNVSARQLEAPTAEGELLLTVDWAGSQGTPSSLEFSPLPSTTPTNDLAWSQWLEENQDKLSENLVSDWVFTEQGSQA